MHILLVEDDVDLAESIAAALRSQGWRVDISDRGEPVPRSLTQDGYDVLLLDLGLPGIDGLETLRRVRAAGWLSPILVLTARDSVQDRVAGLETGADDYLCKPFAPAELVARVRALVRRREHQQAGTYRLGTLRFDTHSQRGAIGDTPLALTARESVVLQYLMARSGEVVARDQLTSLVPGWQAGASDNALELLMSRLRAKIESAGVQLRTVRGLGYLLEAQGDARQ